MLPEPNRLVVAHLTGTSHHTGDGVGWVREGWAFMVRWESRDETVADGWARRFYDGLNAAPRCSVAYEDEQPFPAALFAFLVGAQSALVVCSSGGNDE